MCLGGRATSTKLETAANYDDDDTPIKLSLSSTVLYHSLAGVYQLKSGAGARLKFCRNVGVSFLANTERALNDIFNCL